MTEIVPEVKEIDAFFIDAFNYVTKNYLKELEYTDNNHFEDRTQEDFFAEYVWVVLNAGMKMQIARKNFRKFMQNYDLSVIGHKSKREAVADAMINYGSWFHSLQLTGNKLEYLESLSWIGPITKYHLARNMGLDYAKPDRHLVRLANQFGFKSAQELCEYFAKEFGMRVGTVDLILWRYSNRFGTRDLEANQQKLMEVHNV